jgi:hypothetical protein
MKMSARLRLGLLTICLGFLCACAEGPARAQENETFEDPEGNYSLTLLPGWQAVTNRDPSGRLQLDVIVFRVRENASLKIRRMTVEPKTDTLDYAKQDEQTRLVFQPAYDKGTIEKFVGGIPGVIVTYNLNSTSGRPMAGRNYYLRASETTIYLLTFTGSRNTLTPIRNQTDAIARSLKGK